MSEKVSFTPGEWFIHREGFSTIYIESRLRAGVIQEIAACGPTEAGSEQQEANARLIASAPDLLEALEACVHFANIKGIVNGIDVRAAIRKARGES